jgi:hypothetical protein
MTPQWHVSVKGHTEGPFNESQLRELVSTGRLGPSDLVWREGMKEWAAAGKLKGLFPATASPPPAPPPPTPVMSFDIASGPAVTVVGDGKFAFVGAYAEIFQLVERVFRECDVNVKERSAEQGLLRGKCKYGINPFGITVTATFYDACPNTRVDVAATLTDSFDTFRVCQKKVSQISDRILETASRNTSSASDAKGVTQGDFAFLEPRSPTTASGSPPVNISAIGSRPPSYAQRAGISYRGKAMTGMWLSVGGLFFGPAAIGGLIMSSLALTGMATSTNQQGKGFAIAGLVVGLIAVVGWVLLVLSQL